MKKKMKWILPIVIIAVLVAVLLGVFLSKDTSETQVQKADEKTPYTGKVYWNIERDLYLNSEWESTRMRAGEYYSMRFMSEGQQMNLFVDDRDILNQAENLCFMGLEIDENDVITAVIPVEDFLGGNAGMGFFVTSVTENTILCRADGRYDTPSVEYQYDENTVIFDVSDTGALNGLPGQLTENCEVWVIMGNHGKLSHIFLKKAFELKPVYYNPNRQYDSVTRYTTREPDELGYYQYELVVDGNTTRVQTRDFDIACQVDTLLCMSLTLDENGNILTVDSSKAATGGKSVASGYYVTALTEEDFTAENKNGTAVASGEFAQNLKVYDVSGLGSHLGEETQLRLHDRVHCLKDSMDRVCVVFVMRRALDAEIYWNNDRQYSSDTKTSTRVRSADGWYYIEMATGGKQVTLRTKDKEIVNQIDGVSTRTMGLQVQGDEIIGWYKYNDLIRYMGGSIGGWCTVTSVKDGHVVLRGKDPSSSHYGKTYEFDLSEDVPVYNVSNNFSSFMGEETEIKLGDKLFTLKDRTGKAAYVLVVSRPVSSQIYFNYQRQYDSDRKTSTREKAEDGYYYFDFAVGGTTKTLKTKDKALVDQIDEYSARAIGLRVNGDVITKFFKYTDVAGYSSSVAANYTVTAVDGNKITLENKSDGKTTSFTVSENTKVYNASTIFEKERGEQTQLRPGDKIFGIKGENGQVAIVFITVRTEVAQEIQGTCQACNQEVTWTTWAGSAVLEDGGHYILVDDVVQTKMIGMAAQTTACLNLNGHNITIAEHIGRAFNLYGTLNLMGDGTITSTKTDTSMAPVFYVQTGGMFRMYGGTLTAAASSKRAGIGMIQGTMEMYDGTITGGVATEKNGGNIELLGGTFIMYGGTVSNGTALAGVGGNISANHEEATLKLLGGTVSGGQASAGGGVYALCNVEVGGNIRICENTDSDLMITAGRLVSITEALTNEKAIGMTLTNGTVFTDVVPEGTEAFFFGNDGYTVIRNSEGKLELYKEETEEPDLPDVPDLPGEHYHCVCGESQNHEHTLVNWEPWTGTWVDGGYYYLTEDITDWGMLTVSAGQTLHLCLNGHTVTGNAEAARMFAIRGALHLCDHKTDGTFSGKMISTYPGTSSSNGHVFYVYSGAEFYMYGGELYSENAAYRAPVGVVNGGAMYLYDGILRGNSAAERSGNLWVYGTDGTFEMYGGMLTDGNAGTKGGNLYINSGCTFKMYGGTITGGSAEAGGGVYCCTDAVLGAEAVIRGNEGTDLLMYSGKMVAIDTEHPLTQPDAVGIALEKGTVFTDVVPEGTEEFFFANGAYSVIRNSEGKLELVEGSEEEPEEPVIPDVPQGHTHCICNETQEHEHTQVTWEPWTGIWESGGYYYLNGNVTDFSTLSVEEGQSLYLCLNGYTITGASDCTRMLRIKGDLVLCDHKVVEEDVEVFKGNLISTYTGTDTSMAHVFYVFNTGTFSMYGGEMSVEGTAQKGAVGAINGGKMYLYDGVLHGGSVTAEGGTVYLFGKGTLEMHGGTLTGGQTQGMGGNLYVNSNSTFRMLGGLITAGSAAQGSGVYSANHVYLGGQAQINGNTGTDLHLASGKKITVEETLLNENAVGISLQDGVGVFTKVVDEENIKAFFSNNSFKVIRNANGELELTEEV